MKTLSLCGFMMLGFLAASAYGENFTAPLRCKPSQSYLQVTNSKSEPRAFWFQAIGSSPFREKYHEVAALKTVLFAISDDHTEDTTAIAIKTQSAGFKFKLICKTTKSSTLVESLRSPWKITQLLDGTKGKLFTFDLVNLAQAQNHVEIWLDDILISEITLPTEFASRSIVTSLPGLAARSVSAKLRLRATGAFTAKARDEAGSEVVIVDEMQILKELPSSAVRYFEFRSANKDESFIAPVSDARMVAESLEQIDKPESARLFVAKIAPAQENFNRNFLSLTKNPWSWTVVEAQNYADFAHISCDGSPSVIEERITDWMKNTGGTICFWNFRVTREVMPAEISQSPLSSHPAPPTLPRRR